MVSHTLGTYTSGRTFHRPAVRRRSSCAATARRAVKAEGSFSHVLVAMPVAYLRELAEGNEEAVARSKWRGVHGGAESALLSDPPVAREISEKKLLTRVRLCYLSSARGLQGIAASESDLAEKSAKLVG